MADLISLEQEIRDRLDDIFAYGLPSNDDEININQVKSAPINVTVGSSTVIDISSDPSYSGDGDQIWVLGWYVGASVASGSYQWFSDINPRTGVIPVGINGGGVALSQYPVFKCNSDEDLKITAVDADIDGIVQYVIRIPTGS